MRWAFEVGDILDVKADVLVCSANVFLNLSGGVGGQILQRCGEAMQHELYRILAARGRKFAERGEVLMTPPCGLPFKAVLHAVAVNGFYESSPEVIRSVVDKALAMSAGLGARHVALAALATGYGHLTMAQFAEGVRPFAAAAFAPVEVVTICTNHEYDRAALADVLSPA